MAASAKRSPKSTSNAQHQSVDDFYDKEFASQLKPDQVKTGPGNSLKIKLDHLKTFKALTQNQQLFFDYYNRGDYAILCLGSSGVGKTFLAAYCALQEVLSKDTPYERMIYIRSAVPTRSIGFTPGTLEDKLSLYEDAPAQICTNLFGRKDAYERLKEQGHIEFTSTSFLRGVSFDEAIIVVDEIQSMTWHEISTIAQRVGSRSKIIFCGDMAQNDLVTSKYDVSGLQQFIAVASSMQEFSRIDYTPADIVRSSFTKSFILACAKFGL